MEVRHSRESESPITVRMYPSKGPALGQVALPGLTPSLTFRNMLLFAAKSCYLQPSPSWSISMCRVFAAALQICSPHSPTVSRGFGMLLRESVHLTPSVFSLNERNFEEIMKLTNSNFSASTSGSAKVTYTSFLSYEQGKQSYDILEKVTP
jgi:hypothetical protein